MLSGRCGENYTYLAQGSSSDYENPWYVTSQGRDISVAEGCTNVSYRTEDSLAPPRYPVGRSIPYLIRSRNSALLPNQPLRLSWNPIEGATYYDVKIQYLARSPVIERKVYGTELELDDLTRLTADQDYFVTITASNGVSAPENLNIGSAPVISLLGSERVTELLNKASAIKELNLEDGSEAFSVASLYRSYRLYQEALDMVEIVIQAHPQSVSVRQFQAELYLQMDLVQFAKESYVQSLGIAESKGDIAQQAEIQERLGKISRNLEDFAAAVDWLEDAHANYQEILDLDVLENEERLNDLEELIQDSQKRISNI